jgi:6-pyruvoyl-tetrahydropterin synthase
MLNMLTIEKIFGSYPIAHRQPQHDGLCRLCHGHNLVFVITFFSHGLDKNGFIFDFGKMGFIKEWLTDKFDHTLLLCADDPYLDRFRSFLGANDLAKIVVIPSGSAEGLAEYIATEVNILLKKEGHTHVWVNKVTVFEDEKNSATYEQQPS